MTFSIEKSIEILSRTPDTLQALLSGLSEEWLMENEGDQTWSPYEIVGHLIHGEKTDWIPRARMILSDLEDKTFIPFDRFAQNKAGNQTSIEDLIQEFRALRIKNIEDLKSMQITDDLLDRKGIHPELGEARLKELLASWVVHDLGHISQITRVMAKQYKDEVGVWQAYLGILKR